MQYFPYHPLRKYTSPLFDPLSTTAAALATLGGGSAATGGAMALTGIGAGISAVNTIEGGEYAAQAGRMKQAEANFEADQDVANAAGETAAAQRQGIDVSRKAEMLRSSAVADAAASGVNAGAGSALSNQAQIAARGRYQADMDLWSGQNQATGLLNRAAAKRYEGELDLLGGEEAQRASTLNALSTIAGGGASFMRMYGGKGLF
ncbi:MAG TPA: hypothetical protein VKP67_03455 [Xanthobacteraceae bacterium]|nr:hypothetical protein [Xanthobacteraceae bacterium]